jgi:hypothetical protein
MNEAPLEGNEPQPEGARDDEPQHLVDSFNVAETSKSDDLPLQRESLESQEEPARPQRAPRQQQPRAPRAPRQRNRKPANDDGGEFGGETPETQSPPSPPESAPDQRAVIPMVSSEPFEASIESTSEATPNQGPDQGSQGSIEESDGTTPRRPSRRRTRSRRDRRVPLKSGNTETSTSAEETSLNVSGPAPKAPTFDFSDD